MPGMTFICLLVPLQRHWTGHDSGLTWLTVAMLTLLSGASHNAWTLLIEV